MSVANPKPVSRTPAAWNALLATLIYIFLGAFLIFRHKTILNIYTVVLVLIPLGIQAYGQILRARALATETGTMSPGLISRVFDLLFWAAIGNLLLLTLVAALLRHIDGFI
jgi:hypothetical protein